MEEKRWEAFCLYRNILSGNLLLSGAQHGLYNVQQWWWITEHGNLQKCMDHPVVLRNGRLSFDDCPDPLEWRKSFEKVADLAAICLELG